MKNQSDYRSTLNSQKSISELHHSKSVSFLSTAVENHRNGRYEEAINNYKKAIEVNPNNFGAFFNIGVIYKQMKKYQKSVQYFQRAVQLKPTYTEAYINLGNVCKKIKQFTFSEKYYLKAIELDKKNNGVLNNLGLLYIGLQRYEEGQNIFKKMLQNNPSSQIAYNSLGVIKKNKKQFNEAIKHWQMAIKCNEKFVEPYYNLALLKISENKFEEAEIYLKKSEILKNNNLLVLSVRAINLNKLNRSQQAFQLLDKVNRLINQAPIQEIEEKTKIKKSTLEWIKSTIGQVHKMENLNKYSESMTSAQQKQLKQLNDTYFSSLIECDKKQENVALEQLNKRVRELEKQIKLQNIKIQQIQEDVLQIRAEVEKIKKQFQWDQKFDKLLEQEPQYAQYYRCFYSIVCTSVQAYRTVKTGIVTAGEGIIKSKVGGFVDKLVKILHLGQSLPTISSFCSILSKIGEVYLGKQSQHVCNQIIGATSCLFNDKKLTKATAQMILYLSKQSIYKKMLTRCKSEQKIWYRRIIQKLNSIKQKIESKQKQFLTKATQFGGHDVTEQMNTAMYHSAQIFMFMIKKQNSAAINESTNPLLTAAQLWLKQMLKFRVNIYGAVLKERSGVFNIISGTYCCVIYGEQKRQTEHAKSNDNLIKWNQSQFTFSTKHKVQQIQFQIFDKPLMKKDSLIGIGKIHRTEIKKGKKESIQITSKQKIIGHLQICIQ